MRTWLIVNPASTSVRARLRADVVRALTAPRKSGARRAALDLTVVPTTHRGHATTLAREAAAAGVELLVVMGGDGTVNEVLNGLAGNGHQPMLGLVGGGKTNVFARALGLPGRPLKAAGTLLALLDAGEHRRISLGEAAGRRFACGAGLGLDGAIVREVERQRRANRSHDDRAYVLAGLHVLTHWDRTSPSLQLELAGCGTVASGYFGIVSNGDPYTYLGSRPFRPTPAARFEGGLDVLVGQTMSPALLTTAIAGMLSGRALPPFPGLPVFHDHQAALMVTEVPLPLQVDGEYLGDVTEVEVRTLPDALTVVAPKAPPTGTRPLLAPWWAATRQVWQPWRPPADPDDRPLGPLPAAALAQAGDGG